MRLLAAALVLALTGCGSDAADTSTGVPTDTSTGVSTDTSSPPDISAEPDSSVTPDIEALSDLPDVPDTVPANIIHVKPEDASSLPAMVAQAAEGTVFLLADGTYALAGGQSIRIHTPGITIQGESGNRDAVVLDNNWETGEAIFIAASNVTVKDLTVTRSFWHPIHVVGGESGPTTGTLIDNVKVLDPGQQGIKINTDHGNTADFGIIRNSHIELTEEGRAFVSGCYTGGIDAHAATGWHIHNNEIRGFWCPQGLSEHAVHFWRGSRDTRVESNIMFDNARGVGFGLGPGDLDKDWSYDDSPCDGAAPPMGHWGGIIRNNFISATDSGLLASAFGFDAGIAIEKSCQVDVLHNSVYSSAPPFSSIEWRWPGTTIRLANNLVSHNLRPRNEAVAEEITNITGATAAWFVSESDLHLVSGTAASDQGTALEAGAADVDIDGESRSATPDVGADED